MNYNDHFWYKAVGVCMKKLSSDALKNMKNEDFEVVKEVFDQYSGDWEGLSEGKVEGWRDLRSACKAFLKVRKRCGKRPFGDSEEE